ncbi:hypothetical protein PGT21_009269 [Puccinia graminis f. sp. tritici]|uniref:Uncharacterized protein n=1 Tax=Puccinia graminis f. sp. tritici TaxID=56615 RepID=A0A5B0QIA1_PUCGR|nr:hypothetical protein PGT21_009269 [Puccinia graminis f. sp. tritici]
MHAKLSSSDCDAEVKTSRRRCFPVRMNFWKSGAILLCIAGRRSKSILIFFFCKQHMMPSPPRTITQNSPKRVGHRKYVGRVFARLFSVKIGEICFHGFCGSAHYIVVHREDLHPSLGLAS